MWIKEIPADRRLFGSGLAEIGTLLGGTIQQQGSLDVIRVGLQRLELVPSPTRLLVMDSWTRAKRVDRGASAVNHVERGLFFQQDTRLLPAGHFIFPAQGKRIPHRHIAPLATATCALARRRVVRCRLSEGGHGRFDTRIV